MMEHRIIQSLEKQLDHKIDKAWKIFSWTSTILLAIIAGLFSKIFDQEFEHLEPLHQVLMTFIIIILVLYSIIWIKKNLKSENDLRSRLVEIFSEDKGNRQSKENGKKASLAVYEEAKKTGFGYRNVVYF